MKFNLIKKYLLFLILMLPLVVLAKDYKGAEYRTKESFQYGRFEVRYKASPGSGHTSTFFLYNDIDPMTMWNEIDIEILNRYANDVQFNTIVPRQGNNHVRHQFVPFNPALDFHTYTIEWTPEYVSWFVDSSEVYRQTGEYIDSLYKPQKIMMNIWPPAFEDWVGKWYQQALPKFAYYDYVSYASYTPGSGNIGTDNHFTFQWKDNFDTFDQNRWAKATHTFEGNYCDFIPENVVFQDGKMILCLTDNSRIGFVDNNPPKVLWARANENRVEVHFSELVDAVSATELGNYNIPGVTILEAGLLPNLQTVELEVTGIDLHQNYNLFISDILDQSGNKNRNYGQMINLIMAEPLRFAVKINVGGNAVGDFLGDQLWNESVEYGFEEGRVAITPSSQSISGTEFEEIYYTERFGVTAYHIRVPNGIYQITFLMAENYFNEAGGRIFDIHVENVLVADNVDLYLIAGKYSAVEPLSPQIEVTDHVLDLHFSAETNFSLINGLIVKQLTSDIHRSEYHLPEQYKLFQNYPNPFNSTTRLKFSLNEKTHARLRIYDITGREITTLADGLLEAGQHNITFDGTTFSTGVYFAALETAKSTSVIKLLMLK